MRETTVLVSIDTEEDNWHRSRTDVTTENIGELRTLTALFDRLGVRPTYFTSYQVARQPRAAAVLREIVAAGRAEIGAHLHPWNTPPLDEALVPRNSMLNNLAPDLQRAKLARLTAALREAFDFTPRTFRAGRYGLGRDTVEALILGGYLVDSSVNPYVDLRRHDDGPTFIGAPLRPYRLAADRPVTQPAPGGPLLEIPLSSGISRGPFRFWDPVRRLFEAAPLRWLHVAGVAAQLGVIRRLALSPEQTSAADMVTLSRRLLEHGVHHLHMSLHSPSLKAGLSPFGATPAAVAGIYASIETYLDRLARFTQVRFATVGEYAAAVTRAQQAGALP
jgi:hypothetical protein